MRPLEDEDILSKNVVGERMTAGQDMLHPLAGGQLFRSRASTQSLAIRRPSQMSPDGIHRLVGQVLDGVEQAVVLAGR